MKNINKINYVDIDLRTEEFKGVRYSTGQTVYDEAFIDGQLIGRYWSPNGQIWPEMHLKNEEFQRIMQQFPLEVFQLGIEGSNINDGWCWINAEEKQDDSGLRDEEGKARKFEILLSHCQYPIDVRVCTRLDGSEWLVRWLEITNRGTKATAISSLYPMSGRLWIHKHKRDEVLTSDIESPFEIAYNHSSNAGYEGDFWFEPLKAGEKIFDGGRKGKSGWSRPAFWIRNLLNGQVFVCEFAWSGNWEMKFNYNDAPEHTQVSFAIGMAPIEGEMLRVLGPGETVRTPAVHIGLFQTDYDSIVQSLHKHIRHVVMPKAPSGREIEIEANHRGYLCDRENESDIKHDVDVAAEIGVEMYVIDAGWYGNEPNKWWDNVGDWYTGPWLPNGLEPIRDHVHKRGMKFGLWMELEAVGANSTLLKNHPEWVMTRHGEKVANGRALDLSKPEVAAWVESEIEGVIKRYKLDMFRIDHNNDLGLGGTCERYGFTENVLWRYYETLYAIFDRMRAKFSDVVFQNCAGGGGRLDLGILQRFHNTELSDWMRPPRAQKMFNGLTMSLPPEIGLRIFGTEVQELVMQGDPDFELRDVLIGRPIFRGIAPGLKYLNPYLKERIIHHLRLYKDFIRPLMKDCLVFHHTPCLPLERPATWCTFEYSSPDKSKSVAVVFRLSHSQEEVYNIYPRGIDRGKKYTVYCDNTSEIFEKQGIDLINNGLKIFLQGALSSELVIFEEIK